MWFSRWTGSAWTSPVAVHNFESSGEEEMIIVSNSDIEVYGIVSSIKPIFQTGNYGGDLVLFRSKDSGASWIVERIIDSGYRLGLGLATPQTILNANSELKIVYGHSTTLIFGETYPLKIRMPMYAWGDNGFVYRRFYWGD